MTRLIALLFAVCFIAACGAQSPAPAPTPAPAAGVWTLVKHVRFPIPSDEAIGRYPNEMTCQNEAYLYTEQRAQWWTTYGCELRVAHKLHEHLHRHLRK